MWDWISDGCSSDLIGDKDVMNAKTLPKVDMPNKDGFIPDPRPDVFNYR